jgi:predicted ATPase
VLPEGDRHSSARNQAAKSWELRGATSLSSLRQRQGRVKEAREILADVSGWFSEGFDTSDLRAAKSLVTELT